MTAAFPEKIDGRNGHPIHMVKRYPLIELVTTGRLGPLHTGMTMGYLAAILGSPRYWIADPSDQDAVPNFWGYHHLEFLFSPSADGKMICSWFQFDSVMIANGRASREAFDFSIWLGKLGGKSKPSDYLKALTDHTKVIVQVANESGGPGTVIRVDDTVKIIFDEDETEASEFKQLGFRQRVAIVESQAYCHCITSSLPNQQHEDHNRKSHGAMWISPAEYLEMVQSIGD